MLLIELSIVFLIIILTYALTAIEKLIFLELPVYIVFVNVFVALCAVICAIGVYSWIKKSKPH
jgi:hypothetical protein